MLNLTPEEKIELQKNTAFALSHFDEGADTKDVLKKIYLENMQGKSEKQAELMADSIISTVNNLFNTYEKVCDAKGDTVKEKLSDMLNGFTDEQKAEILMAAKHSFGNIYKIKKGITVDESALKAMYQMDSSKNLETLLDEAVSVMESPEVMGSFSELFSNCSIEDIRARINVNGTFDDRAIAAVQSMIIYTMVKNGHFKDFPEGITIDQTVNAVSTEAFMGTLTIRKEEGTISENDYGMAWLFWMLALLIVAAMIALTAVCFAETAFVAIEAVLIGSLVVVFASALPIMILYMFFSDVLNCDVLSLSDKYISVSDSNKEEITSVGSEDYYTEEIIYNYERSEDVQEAEDPVNKPVFSTVDEDKLYERLWTDELPY